MHPNIRDFVSHQAELEARIRLMPSLPSVICLNETFLDKSIRTISLNGYMLVSRRDRQDDSGWGGICCFARNDFASNIVHVETSRDAERQWHELHSSCGPFLLVNQYRPPHYGETLSIDSLDDDMASFHCNTFGTIILGDFNVHNKAWLKYSSHDSPEGYALQNFCQRHGFQNYVTMPTRGNHLLDLVLSDLADHVRCEVLPPISDHNLVLAFVSIRYEVGER